jgi:hypothetical protein
VSFLETPLRHLGTGRSAAVLRVDEFRGASPIGVAHGKYILVVGSEETANLLNVEGARAWVDAGACYVCAWGLASARIEETFDYASYLPELGEPLPYTLMTTSHENESLEEALWFAF